VAVITQATTTFTWDFQPNDPIFSLYLVNEEFHDTFAIANNVYPTEGQITLSLPVLPVRGGYTLKATDVGDIGKVYSETAQFTVAANPNVTTTTTRSSTSGTATTRTTSGTGTTLTTPGTSSTNLPSIIPTTTPLVTTSASSTVAPTPLNGAATFKMNNHVGTFAAVLFSAIAGAAVFVL